MNGCQTCQDLLLDHLYGLLDAAEESSLRQHLNGCPACQQALEAARGQQQLLATAARREFPEVVFAVPTEAVPGPTILPLAPQRPLRRWVVWAAAAAAILLVLVGLSAPVLKANADQHAARQLALAHEAKLDQAREEIRLTERLLAFAVEQRNQKVRQVQQEVRERELRVVVSGPRNIQPGAASDFLVRTTGADGTPADAELNISINAPPMDEKTFKKAEAEKDVGEAKADARGLALADAGPRVQVVSKGVYRVQLPPTLPVDAGRTLAMSITARRKDMDNAAPAKALSLQGAVQLTEPVYITHLTTDRPMYQPGEVVRFRSLTLDRATLTPPALPLQLRYALKPPSGPVKVVAAGSSNLNRRHPKTGALQPVLGPDDKPLGGVGAGETLLLPDAPGGEYVLTVSEESGRFPPVSRRFLVNEYQKPRLDRKLELNRSSYGPGDEVQVLARARRLDGGILADCPVEGALIVDGTRLAAVSGKLNEGGETTLRFSLPQHIERGVGSVEVKFNAPGTPETSVRPIPIVLNRLELEFFPEGGDLIAGLPNRVYFQARTPAGKPAQVSGTVLQDGQPLPVRGETLADAREPGVNQGLGAFTLTPLKGKRYSFRVDQPTGITTVAPLPEVRPNGVVLHVPGGVFYTSEPIIAHVHSSTPRTLLVGAYCRGSLVDSVQLAPGQTRAELRSDSPVGGVCRITVFDVVPTGNEQRALRPVAERLVYRHPGKRVDVSILPSATTYSPGQKASLQFLATDEAERPAPVVAQVAVVDQGTLALADDRKARAMPTHFLLATEVRRAEDLEHADFLVGQHPRAPEVLDLLLGTQGWRRFAEQATPEFRSTLAKPGEAVPVAERQRLQADAEKLLVMLGQSTPRRTDFDQERIDRAEEEFEEQLQEMQEQETQAQETYESAQVAYESAKEAVRHIERNASFVRAVALFLALATGLVVAGGLGLWWLRQSGQLSGIGLLLVVVTLPALLGLKVASVRVTQSEASINRAETLEKAAAGERLDLAPMAPQAEDGRMDDQDGGAPPPPAAAPPGSEGDGPLAGAIPEQPQPGRMLAPKVAPPGVVAAPDRQQALDRIFFEAGVDGRIRALRELTGRDLLSDLPRRMPMLDNKAKAIAPGFAGGFGGGRAMPGRPGLGRAMDAMAPPQLPPLVFREYAHLRPDKLPPALRADFSETVYWHPVLVLPEGKGEASFQLPDSVTKFHVSVFAHTLDGRLGSATHLIESRLPVNVAPKVPTEVTASDRLLLPASISSTADTPLSGHLEVTQQEGLAVDQGRFPFRLAAQGSQRVFIPVRPSLTEGRASLALSASGTGFAADTIRQSFRVVPEGFPVERSSSELLEKSATHRIELPGDVVAGSLRVRVDLYSSLLADLTKGMDGLLQEPHGCFEQSSSSNYPNLLVLDYLRSTKKASPAVESRARRLLESGYQKLTSFECQEPATSRKRGYEWFGGTAPPHDALTAYGLLQFHDMARVQSVDAAMLGRTRDHLLSLRDGKGGFRRSERALDSFGRAPDHITAAYIVWSLSETGKDDLKSELDELHGRAEKSDDAYFLALVALGLHNTGRTKEATALLQRIARAQKPDGHLVGETSITTSGGISLKVETTALAILGWLRVDRGTFARNAHLATGWLAKQRQGSGSFGSTQATILALKALLAQATDSPEPKGGELKLFLEGREIARRQVPAAASEVITLEVPDAPELFKPGTTAKVRVELEGGGTVPHTLTWSYRTIKPANPAAPLVTLETSLARQQISEGETTQLRVKAHNRSGKPQGMVTAIVGLPAGLALPENLEQLRSHCKPGAKGEPPLISAFEVKGRELVLYWRGMDKDQTVEVPIDVLARVPGSYQGPASRAYLYYHAENKFWVAPLVADIKPADIAAGR